MHHALRFAHLLIKPRTASVAQQHGQHVQHRQVGMTDFGDVPGKMKMREFNRRFFDDFPRRGLFGFLGEDHGRQWSRLGLFVGGAYLGDHVIIFYVTHHNVENVVGRVFFAVVTTDVVRFQLVENVRDNR